MYAQNNTGNNSVHLLNNIYNKHIQLDEDEVAKSKRIIKEVVEENMIPAMKSVDRKFAEYFQEILWGGSMYDKLRVKEPTEYDLDFILKLPENEYGKIQVFNPNENPGYVRVKTTKCPVTKTKRKQLYQEGNPHWFSLKNNLMVSRVREWWGTVFKQAIYKIKLTQPRGLQNYQLNYSESGPAMTLNIIPNNWKPLDVDFVLALQFTKSDWPNGILRSGTRNSLHGEFGDDLNFLVVPKPGAKGPGPDVSWRLGFQQSERELLANKGCAKKVLRIAKALRDELKQTDVSSYDLKTMMLHILDESRQHQDIYEDSNIGVLFNVLLEKWQFSLQSKTLNHFWCPQMNLWENKKNATFKKYHNQIVKFTTAFDKDHHHITKYFP